MRPVAPVLPVSPGLRAALARPPARSTARAVAGRIVIRLRTILTVTALLKRKPKNAVGAVLVSALNATDARNRDITSVTARTMLARAPAPPVPPALAAALVALVALVAQVAQVALVALAVAQAAHHAKWYKYISLIHDQSMN